MKKNILTKKSLLFLAVGILLLVSGLLVGSHYNDRNTACNSSLGQLGQILSSDATQNCDNVAFYMYASFVGAFAGLLLIIVGAVYRW